MDRDDKFPGKLIHLRISAFKVVNEIHKGSMYELYNAIFMTLHETASINEHGYCGTNSSHLANKIWALAFDWEALLKRSPTYRNP